MKLLKKFRKSTVGAVAVETAMTFPILAFGLIAALDMGIVVYKKQDMSKTTKSGIQYVINGGRLKSETVSIMSTASGSYIPQSAVSLTASCGCITRDQSTGDTQTEEQFHANQDYGYSYVKTDTDLAVEMCPTPCPDGQQATALVKLNWTRDIRGLVKTRTLSSSLQTRLQ